MRAGVAQAPGSLMPALSAGPSPKLFIWVLAFPVLSSYPVKCCSVSQNPQYKLAEGTFPK